MPMMLDGTTCIRSGATHMAIRAGLGGCGMLELRMTRMMSRATPNDVPGSVAPGSGADAATATGPAGAAHADMTRGKEGLGGGQPAVGQVRYGPTGVMHSRSTAVGTTINTGTATADAKGSAGSGIRPGSRGAGADVARRGGRPCSRIGKRGRGRPTTTTTAAAAGTALPAVRVVPGLHLADGRPIDDGGLHELPQLLPRISLGLPSQPRGAGTGTGR